MMPTQRQSFLADAADMLVLGTHSLKRDIFSECFQPSSKHRAPKNPLTSLASFIVRYFILLPIRLSFLLVCALFCSAGILLGAHLNCYSLISGSITLGCKILLFTFNCTVKHTGNKQRATAPHVYVANHTSFLDYFLMSSYKFSHACIAENHGGLFGLLFRFLLSKNGSVAFRRSEKQDRVAILGRVQRHIWADKSPLVIFPEGTCVNNRYILLFQQGAFSLDVPVYPVSIKYNKDSMDPYWNRRAQGFAKHILYLLTRWSIQATIHWGEAAVKYENETSIHFSHRVKYNIAMKAGLRNTLWNGYFKSSPCIRDKEMLIKAYKNVYARIQESTLSELRRRDLKRDRFYLLDENIFIDPRDSPMFFSQMKQSAFINEWCKEYLRLKEESHEYPSIPIS